MRSIKPLRGGALAVASLMFAAICLTPVGCGTGDLSSIPRPTPTAEAEEGALPSLFSDKSREVLGQAPLSYREYRDSMEPSQARTALLDQLNDAYPGVKSARLFADGYTVLIQLEDGMTAAINTYDGFETQPQEVTAKLREPQATSQPSIRASSWPKTIAAGSDLFPASKKVLLMSSGHEDFFNADVSDDDTLPLTDRTGLFADIARGLVERGWSLSDFDVKYNRNDSADATLVYDDLRFEDFFGLSNYGVIIIAGHGAYDYVYDDKSLPGTSPTNPHYYVQVANVSIGRDYPMDSLTHDEFVSKHGPDAFDLLHELVIGRVMVCTHIPGREDEAAAKHMVSYYYVRDDLLAERMSVLPNSYVYMLSCHGWHAADVFAGKGAGSFAGWDDVVTLSAGLEAGLMIPLMYEDNISAYGAYQGVSRVSTWRAVVSNLLITSDTEELYLPTWVNTITRPAPASATSVEIKISYADPSLPLPDPSEIRDVPSSPSTFNNVIPGQEAIFTAVAYDSSNNPVGQIEKTLAVETGQNQVIIRFSEYGIILSADPASIDADGTSVSTITAELRKYLDTDLTYPTGDPVPDKRVTFAATDGEFVSGGLIVSTTSDADGLATAQLVGETDAIVEVFAEVSDDDVAAAEPVTVRIGEPEYDIVVELEPPAVVFDPGTTETITATATLRYCMTPGEYPPTGDPVIGKTITWGDTNSRYVDMIGDNPGTTDTAGQARVTLATDKEITGDITATVEDDLKARYGRYRFEWREAESYFGTLRGEVTRNPDEGYMGCRVFVEFDKVFDPQPSSYEVFGFNYHDYTSYFGNFHLFEGPPFTAHDVDNGTTWQLFLTGGGGDWDPETDKRSDAEVLEWYLGRFAGSIWMITPLYD